MRYARTIALCLLGGGWALAEGPDSIPPLSLPATQASAPAATEILGVWKGDGDKPTLLQFEAARFRIWAGGRLSVMKVRRYEGEKVLATDTGSPVTFTWKMKDGKLRVPLGGKNESFERLGAAPPELEIAPMRLPAGANVPAGRVAKVQLELAARMEKDQAVRKAQPMKYDAVMKQDAENIAYLKPLIAEVGWIDVNRFGAQTAQAAFLMVQHSGNLPLMLAALPEIEKDVKAGNMDALGYAMLYDRLQLMLGENQRYGTQVGKNDKGQLVVMPLEDKAKVDALRKELKLMPLSEYLELVKKQMHGKEIVMPE